MRRLTVSRPIPVASAARHAAVFSFYVVAIATLLLRFGLVETRPGLAALAAGLCVAVLAILLALAAAVTIWRSGVAGGGRALFAVMLAGLLLALPAYYGAQALIQPRVNDVTTDFDDPPLFTVAAASRPRDANRTRYDPTSVARQRQAYPAIHPLIVDLPPDEVRRLLLSLVRQHKWRLVADMPLTMPETSGRAPVRFPSGRIEAVARSLILGLEEDVAIRIRDEDGRTRIDMRSASRYGRYDFGANARRVSDFLEEVQARIQGTT